MSAPGIGSQQGRYLADQGRRQQGFVSLHVDHHVRIAPAATKWRPRRGDPYRTGARLPSSGPRPRSSRRPLPPWRRPSRRSLRRHPRRRRARGRAGSWAGRAMSASGFARQPGGGVACRNNRPKHGFSAPAAGRPTTAVSLLPRASRGPHPGSGTPAGRPCRSTRACPANGPADPCRSGRQEYRAAWYPMKTPRLPAGGAGRHPRRSQAAARRQPG